MFPELIMLLKTVHGVDIFYIPCYLIFPQQKPVHHKKWFQKLTLLLEKFKESFACPLILQNRIWKSDLIMYGCLTA